METMSPASAFSAPHEQQNYEEYSMEQSLLFSDSLKDLKNLRSQLYSAAEYFEVSYTNDDQKEIVVNTLKDYTINALVNTVDHLGSVTYKVTDLLDEKVDEVSGTELRVSCIEQRLRTCQECIDHEGLSQQALVMTTPKYHKRYILPDKHAPPCSFLSVDETILSSEPITSKYQDGIRDNVHHPSHLINGVQTTTRRTQSDTIRKCRSRSPSPQPSSRPGPFSFTEKTGKQKHSEKRSASPLRSMFPLLRSASPSSRSSTPHSSRPTTPTPSRPRTPTPARPRTPTPTRPTTPHSFNTRLRYRQNTQKSSSSHLHAEQDDPKDIEQHPSKSKRLFKALLSRRKVKQDDTLYTYLDEY